MKIILKMNKIYWKKNNEYVEYIKKEYNDIGDIEINTIIELINIL